MKKLPTLNDTLVQNSKSDRIAEKIKRGLGQSQRNTLADEIAHSHVGLLYSSRSHEASKSYACLP